MGARLGAFVLYFSELIFLTVGVVVLCGFAVRLCSRLFLLITGRGAGTVYDITSFVGTPIHELGHALMCIIFAHKITGIKLWSPGREDGVYGYVEHSYNKRNPWARFGNLPIGLGPIFSGLGVIVLVLWLCFPDQWGDYLVHSSELLNGEPALPEVFGGIFSLFASIPSAFGGHWIRATVGLLIILPVSLHITLSWADVRSSLSAVPFYLLLVLIFALVTALFGAEATILSGLWLFNLRLLSLFCIVIAFSAVWILIALTVLLLRLIIKLF